MTNLSKFQDRFGSLGIIQRLHKPPNWCKISSLEVLRLWKEEMKQYTLKQSLIALKKWKGKYTKISLMVALI